MQEPFVEKKIFAFSPLLLYDKEKGVILWNTKW